MQATFLSSIEIPGQPRFFDGTGGMIGYRFVTPDYFTALGIRIVSGRAFRAEDLFANNNPVILSAALAKRLLPGADPVGKSVFFRNRSTWRTVVGVAADVKNGGLTVGADPEFYLPWKPEPEGYFRRGHLFLRTPQNPQALAGRGGSAVAARDPAGPVLVATNRPRARQPGRRPRI